MILRTQHYHKMWQIPHFQSEKLFNFQHIKNHKDKKIQQSRSRERQQKNRVQ